ncbi:tRNA pseudouridine(38-40) synthase TruA [soil metagenome]
MLISYDGTDFYGWQIQPGHTTVIGVLQQRFKAVFGKDIHIAGASRTDAGVHALGQVAVFNTDLNITAGQLHHAWQNVLPVSVLIRELIKVDLDWNPRHHVKQKTYTYHFFQERPLPFAARYGWYYRHPVNIEKLKECLDVFVGTHDFRSFCSGDDMESTVRTIDEVSVEFINEFNAYRINIKGPGFLRYMIRRIVGACLEVASRDTLGIEDLKKALAEKNPLQVLPSAPAQGLLLYRIEYHDQKQKIDNSDSADN